MFVRRLTTNPFTINYNLPLNLVSESQFAYTNVESFNQFFFFDHMFNDKTTLVVWEHKHIQASVKYLLTNYYNISMPADFPVWAEDDYDTLYKLEFNNSGKLTFSNTCEGISNLSLPLSCPTFSN